MVCETRNPLERKAISRSQDATRKILRKKTYEKIYKQIPPQEGFLSLTNGYTKERMITAWIDQKWIGLVYDLQAWEGNRSSAEGEAHFNSLLLEGQNGTPGFKFVEAYSDKTPDLLFRYELATEKRFGEDHWIVQKTPIENSQSRYAVELQDISTAQEREHFVFCGRRRILDLKTQETVAELTGCRYFIPMSKSKDSYLNKFGNEYPENFNSCRQDNRRFLEENIGDRSRRTVSEDFIFKVLLPTNQTRGDSK